MSCRQPCLSCPWRVDRHAADIPGFDLAKAEALESSTSDKFGAPVFACHQSVPEQEVVCVGWLVRYGYHNISIRLMLLNNLMKPEALEIGPGWPELHHTFDELIEKLRCDSATSVPGPGYDQPRLRNPVPRRK